MFPSGPFHRILDVERAVLHNLFHVIPHVLQHVLTCTEKAPPDTLLREAIVVALGRTEWRSRDLRNQLGVRSTRGNAVGKPP